MSEKREAPDEHPVFRTFFVAGYNHVSAYFRSLINPVRYATSSFFKS